MPTIYFHGTQLDQQDLLAALAHNCMCEQDAETGISKCCPGHTALVTDQKWLNHMEWARSQRARFCAEEFTGADRE